MTETTDPITVTIDGSDRRHVAAAVRAMARDVEGLYVSLNSASPRVQRMYDCKRSRLAALADAICQEHL